MANERYAILCPECRELCYIGKTLGDGIYTFTDADKQLRIIYTWMWRHTVKCMEEKDINLFYVVTEGYNERAHWCEWTKHTDELYNAGIWECPNRVGMKYGLLCPVCGDACFMGIVVKELDRYKISCKDNFEDRMMIIWGWMWEHLMDCYKEYEWGLTDKILFYIVTDKHPAVIGGYALFKPWDRHTVDIYR